MPLYNKAAAVLQAVNSVLSQEYTDFDLLIINDGSTDQSLELVEHLKNERILIKSQENQGVSATRNRALQFARENNYDSIAFLDADDYWKPNHLSLLTHLFTKFPEAQAVASNYSLKRSRKTLETKWSHFKNENEQLLEHFFEHNFLNSIFTCSTLMIKTEAIEKVGLFNERLTHFEDIDWFIRLGINLKITFSFQVTTIIDEAADNRSDQTDMKNRSLPDFLTYETEIKKHKGLEKYLDLNRFSIALAYRMENDIRNATFYQQKINLKNLSSKQQKLLLMSRLQLKSLKRTQKILGNLGLHLRAGD
uniref:glycosyltransferase family 2 protein n=1 Tax=Nonlabens sp. Ci31 TaxID=2608253 RepID=UPI0021D2BF92|nr:glycosyltransferase family A protein [Nonlabens sp. Ci31]